VIRENRRRETAPPIFLYPANDNVDPKKPHGKFSIMDAIFLLLLAVAAAVSFLRY
jgi:hypothetical protein